MAFEKYIKIGVTLEEHRQVKAKASGMGLQMQEIGYRWFMDWLSGKSSQTRSEHVSQPSAGSDMISVAELNEADTQLVVNLIAMLRDGESPVLPLLREGLKNYTPEARDEDVGRKDRRHRPKNI